VFFEPLPAVEVRTTRPARPFAEWSAPSQFETGAIIPVERMVARSEHVVIRLPSIRVFRTGCVLDVEVVSRQAGLSFDDWWYLRMSGHLMGSGYDGAGELPDRLLRFGIRYPDGTKVTTIEKIRVPAPAGAAPPNVPVRSGWPGGAGRLGGGQVDVNGFGLWLWPLPPAETFEFAAEWPAGGIELAIIELDGRAINAAAERSVDFWRS
jgi:hypothetical protein